MLTWSSSNNLVFNAAKTKVLLMEKLHDLEQDVVQLKCTGKTLEDLNEFKVSSLTIEEKIGVHYVEELYFNKIKQNKTKLKKCN